MNTNFLYISIILIISIISKVNSINILDLYKRNVEFDEEVYNNLSEECIEEDQHSDISSNCLPYITLNNYKEKCQSIKSEKCQNFYNDPNPSKYYPICNQFPQYNEFLQPNTLKALTQTYDIKCLTDENNELCPFSIYSIVKGDKSNVLIDNCKSKKCTDSLIKFYKSINIDNLIAYENLTLTSGEYSYEELTSFNSFVSILESDECRNLQITNNATNIKNNNNILLFLFLLLILLY
ncbi:hypothetical protein BCR36DRAFT_311557 [Piromyces finnis]|uniref:Uncharacterized protein n=1 Tax=Piromyces finnis TaxID=1754191 RepID=A0A1Y1UUU3_9FUNG|nr:hypothetical protein BCR36DRAFT_311557 [Piromyces finnis]|eukprot:ORX41397.1 hypothetical protein BCR36DRAFT_311557 [Piromyces finnis]